MINAPTLEAINERLGKIDLQDWGPGGIRYVCILFWNEAGYRHLENEFSFGNWDKWSRSSGDFWDLFLAGCYAYGRPDRYGAVGEPLAGEGSKCMRWHKDQADFLAAELAAKAAAAGSPEPWTFTGPIELVAVGARRGTTDGGFSPNNDYTIDWASLRGATIRPSVLPEAIGSYTESHISLNPDDVPSEFPSPGSFQDEVWPEVKRELFRRIPLIGKLLQNAA